MAEGAKPEETSEKALRLFLSFCGRQTIRPTPIPQETVGICYCPQVHDQATQCPEQCLVHNKLLQNDQLSLLYTGLSLGVGDIDKNESIFFQYLDIDIQTIFLKSFKELCANWQRRSSWSFDLLHLTYYCIELLVHKDMRHY